MPLKTFFNLSEQRQKEILKVCFTEFAKNDYNSASLARIIKQLDIARGSFYRYFENKADLYIYLYNFGMEEILKDIKSFLKDPHRDFYEAWVEFGLASIKKGKEYPFYLVFLSRAASERRPELFSSDTPGKMERKISFTGEFIRFHQETKQVRDDVDTDLLVLMMIHTRYALRHYFLLKYSINIEEQDGSRLYDLYEDKIKHILNDYKKLIEGMMKPPSR